MYSFITINLCNWFNLIIPIIFVYPLYNNFSNIVCIERYHTFPLEFLTKNRLFLWSQLSLESKTNSNQQQIGCLVYHEITQISERPFKSFIRLQFNFLLCVGGGGPTELNVY